MYKYLTFVISEFYTCVQCGRKYKTKTGFMFHMRVECGKLPEFCCRICKKEFKHKGSYKRHLCNVHKIIYNT